MKETTTLPVWLVVVLTVVPAIIAAASAVLVAWFSGARKAAGQLDRWRRREETMRLLRWAADKASSSSDQERVTALGVLEAIDQSKPSMLQPEDQGILDAVIDVAVSAAYDTVEGYPATEDVEEDRDGG